MQLLADEYKLGAEILRVGSKVKWLVTRIVLDDQALVIDSDGKESIVVESYVQLKAEDGEIDFVLLLHKEIPFTTSPERKVPSLPSLWRKRDQCSSGS